MKKDIHEFIEVEKDHFFAKLPKGAAWHQSMKGPEDVSWWEAHIEYVIHEGQTVGYRRTSSYGAPDEYCIHHSLLPKKMDQV